MIIRQENPQINQSTYLCVYNKKKVTSIVKTFLLSGAILLCPHNFKGVFEERGFEVWVFIIERSEVCSSHGHMSTSQAAVSPTLFSPPTILFVRPPVNVAAGLASFLALLLLISARHRDRQKEKPFSGRS